MKHRIKEILKERNIKPKKRWGQNFLICQKPIDQIIKAAELKADDIVLEIGPGLGALTLAIAKQVKQVIAIEKDSKMVGTFEETLKKNKIENVKLINQDILNFQFSIFNFQSIFNDQISNTSNKKPKYKIIGNLPYNIATAAVMKFLEAEHPPTLMAVMLQKEVAQRMRAKPPRMNKLAVFTQFYANPAGVKIVNTVSKKCFHPQPKVDSAVLSVRPVSDTGLTLKQTKMFSRIVKAGFSHPRKQLINNFTKNLNCFKSELSLKFEAKKVRQEIEKWLVKNKIRPEQRAETLSLDNWKNLTKTAKSYLDECSSK